LWRVHHIPRAPAHIPRRRRIPLSPSWQPRKTLHAAKVHSALLRWRKREE
jgi:hypothetical protein